MHLRYRHNSCTNWMLFKFLFNWPLTSKYDFDHETRDRVFAVSDDKICAKLLQNPFKHQTNYSIEAFGWHIYEYIHSTMLSFRWEGLTKTLCTRKTFQNSLKMSKQYKSMSQAVIEDLLYIRESQWWLHAVL